MADVPVKRDAFDPAAISLQAKPEIPVAAAAAAAPEAAGVQEEEAAAPQKRQSLSQYMEQ